MPALNVKGQILKHLPGTVFSISETIGFTTAAIAKNLRALEADNQAHISGMRGGPYGRAVVWSAGPYPEGLLKPKPRAGRAIKVPTSRQFASMSTTNEDETIEKARAAPASWFSGLG